MTPTAGDAPPTTPSPSRGPWRSVWRSLGWSGAGIAIQAAAGVATFTLIARALGPADFGVYSVVLALAALTPTIVVAGDGALLARDLVARGSAPRAAVTRRLRLGAITLPVVAALAVGATLVIDALRSPAAMAALAVMVVAEVTAFGIGELVAGSYAAHDRYRESTVMMIAVALTRVVAVAGVVASGAADGPLPIAAALAVAGALTAAAGVALLPESGSSIDTPRPDLDGPTGRAADRREGLVVGGGRAAQRAVTDIDQALLLRSSAAATVGFYAVGARLVGYAYLPIFAALRVTFPRFLAHGAAGGLPATIAYGRRVAPWYLAGGLALSAGVVAAASVIPWLVGDDYADARPMAIALAGVPVLRVVQSVVGDVLAGADHFADRTTAVVTALIVNVAANLALIPAHGWRGAVVATYTAEVIAIGALMLLVRRRLREPSPPARPIPEMMS